MASSDEGNPSNGSTQSIEDMDLTLGVALPGTQEQLSFELGSEYKLSDSTLKLMTGAIPEIQVDGQFQEGDRIKVILEIEVEYIAFPPIKDRGMRVGTERRHYGTVIAAATAE